MPSSLGVGPKLTVLPTPRPFAPYSYIEPQKEQDAGNAQSQALGEGIPEGKLIGGVEIADLSLRWRYSRRGRRRRRGRGHIKTHCRQKVYYKVMTLQGRDPRELYVLLYKAILKNIDTKESTGQSRCLVYNYFGSWFTFPNAVAEIPRRWRNLESTYMC